MLIQCEKWHTLVIQSKHNVGTERMGGGITHTNSEVMLECKFSLWSVKGINKGVEMIKSTR